MTTMPNTPGRWSDPTWRDVALAWADAELDRRGLRRTSWTMPHDRPWSAVLRIETTADPLWLKANGDGTRHEAALLATLAQLDVAMTPRPYAADARFGLTLMPDGGPTVGTAHSGSTPQWVLERLLVDYAAVQRGTEQHLDAFLGVGIDDLRPSRLPDLLAEIVDETSRADGVHRLSPREAARLYALLPAYTDACRELDESGIAATLQHDDLHDNNILERGPVFIDWGDAVVSHPFGTMLATLNSAAHHHGLGPDDPSLHRLADAYTESWTDVADRATLRRQVELAIRVGPLTRALGWRRALLGSDDASWTQWGDGVHGWLLETLSPDLPLRPPLLD